MNPQFNGFLTPVSGSLGLYLYCSLPLARRAARHGESHPVRLPLETRRSTNERTKRPLRKPATAVRLRLRSTYSSRKSSRVVVSDVVQTERTYCSPRSSLRVRHDTSLTRAGPRDPTVSARDCIKKHRHRDPPRGDKDGAPEVEVEQG